MSACTRKRFEPDFHADTLVFPSESGAPIAPHNLRSRLLRPVTRACRRFKPRFRDNVR